MADSRSSKQPLVIHHSGCADGICGAMVLWFGLGRTGELLPAQYGDAPPSSEEVRGREVWIVDFSYPREELERLEAEASSLRVFDHHGTAEANCEGLPFCTFDGDRCGAKIALDAMLEEKRLLDEAPALVDCLAVLVNYVQDRDLWRWELEHSREISAWLASHPRTLASWLQVLALIGEHGFAMAVEHGASILRNNAILISAMAWQAEAVEWVPPEGPPWGVLLVNAPVLHSEVADRLLQRRGDECKFVCCWRRIKGKYVYNLRSTTVDVSEVAKTYGGGGHKSAAGFASTSRPAWFFIQPEVD